MATEDSQINFMFFGFLHTHFLDLAAALTRLCTMYDYVPPTHTSTLMCTLIRLCTVYVSMSHSSPPHMYTHPSLHRVHLYVPLTHTHTLTHLCTVYVSMSHSPTHTHSPASAPCRPLCPTHPRRTRTARRRLWRSAGRSPSCRVSTSRRSGHSAACRTETCRE